MTSGVFNTLIVFTVLILILLNPGTIYAQNIVLSRFSIEDQYGKNCGVIKNCIDSIQLTDHSLLINLTVEDACVSERRLTYKLLYDTLSLNYYSEPTEKDTVIYNEKTGNYDSTKYYSLSISVNQFIHSCKTFFFGFTGLNRIPRCIVYNSEILRSCPVTNVSFLVHRGDTINIINANGNKEGGWLTYYDTGEILKVKNYKNGRFLNGYIFDKEGNITHIVDEEEQEIDIPVEDYKQMHK
jgi:hypothetical protein